MNIKTEILIHANPEVVWDLIVGFDKYPKWNSFMQQVWGEAGFDKTIKVIAKIPKGPKMFFKARINQFDRNKELRWKGNFIFDLFFLGEHYFKLEKIAENKTLLIHGENFTGILLPMFNYILSGSKSGFELMNKEIKEIAERS